MIKRKDLIVKENPGLSLSRMFDFGRFHDMIDTLEEKFFDDVMPWNWWTVETFKEIQPFAKSSFPKVNVIDKENLYDVEIAVAGFDKEDLSLELKDNCLFIRANKDKTNEADFGDNDRGNYVLKEIATRSFKRVVRFPSEIDVENIECNCKDGIVKCSIAKKKVEEKDDSIKIEIK